MIPIKPKDRLLIELLSPSILSGILVVSAGLLISIGTIISFSLDTNPVQQQLLEWQRTQDSQEVRPNRNPTQSDKPTLSGSWPLIIVWSFIGLGVYIVAASVIRSVNRTAELRKSLTYVNARPKSILEMTAESLALRLTGFAILVGLLYLFIHLVVPYSITAAWAAGGDIISAEGPVYLLLSALMVVVSLHVITIFLRLSLGRSRAFYL